MPKVSVVIPNYNHAKYLKQRINTVLNQTYSDFEIIILDDCSTDNSREIIEQYRCSEKVSHIVYNGTNSGSTFKQWDKGINLAKGDYIWIAESDDWCELNFLEVIVTGIENKENVVLGYCQSFCINDTKEIVFQSTHSMLDEYYPKEKYLEEFLCFRNAIFNASMAVFKRSFYYKISDFYKSFKLSGDSVFWAELSRLGTIYISARPLNYFRKHDNDVTGKMYGIGMNFIEDLKALNHYQKKLNLDSSLYTKEKIRLYNRFSGVKNKIGVSASRQIKSAFFSDISFLQKQYFLVHVYLYKLRKMLK